VGERVTRKFKETSARHQSARASPELAEVVNRPKKRPGRRIVDHDPFDKPASDGLIWNHFVF